MIELNQALLREAIDDLNDIESNLKEATRHGAEDSIYRDIEREVDREIVSPVLQRARELGEPHVGSRVSEIQPVTGEWRGDRYVAGLRSDNEVVLSHEYGSGQYGAGNGPYSITPTNKKALSFTVDGRPVVVDYVLHPGVRGKRFMQRAIRERSDEIMEQAADEVQQTLADAFDT